MNPFNNRWVALFCVLALLLLVAELVGTDDHDGVLSQAAKSYSAGEETGGEGAVLPPPEARFEPAPPVIEEPPENVPDEDMPQVVPEDQVEDSADLSAVDLSEPEMAEDAPIEDDPSEQ